MDIPFTKLSACGNDFICIDNRDGHLDAFFEGDGIRDFVRHLCRRGLGVGADGVIFAGPVGTGGGVDILARFFEPDGSEVELCGNGVGAFVHWVFVNRWVVTEEEMRVLTSAGVVRGQEMGPRQVRVCIPTPTNIQRELSVRVEERDWLCDYMVVGVPHLVIYVDDLERLEIQHFGPLFRHHERFGPRGVNANFCQIQEEGQIAVRTYEFGVENETLACGTGSSASAIASFMRSDWSSSYAKHETPVRVRVQSGETLQVWFQVSEEGQPFDVCIETIVRRVYHGTLDSEFLSEVLPAREET